MIYLKAAIAIIIIAGLAAMAIWVGEAKVAMLDRDRLAREVEVLRRDLERERSGASTLRRALAQVEVDVGRWKREAAAQETKARDSERAAWKLKAERDKALADLMAAQIPPDAEGAFRWLVESAPRCWP